MYLGISAISVPRKVTNVLHEHIATITTFIHSFIPSPANPPPTFFQKDSWICIIFISNKFRCTFFKMDIHPPEWYDVSVFSSLVGSCGTHEVTPTGSNMTTWIRFPSMGKSSLGAINDDWKGWIPRGSPKVWKKGWIPVTKKGIQPPFPTPPFWKKSRTFPTFSDHLSLS